MKTPPIAFGGNPNAHAISAVVVLATILQVTALTKCLFFSIFCDATYDVPNFTIRKISSNF